MSVAPWSEDTPALLTQSLSHVATATLVMPDGEEVPLDLIDGTVGWDETRAPRVTANLTCKVPGDQALLNRIDPRTGARLIIDAGYDRPDNLTDIQPLANLGLRSRSVTRPSDTMTLTASSDEALIIDNSPSNGGSVTNATTIDAIAEVIRLVFPGVPIDGAGTPYGAAVSQSPLGDKWQVIMDLGNRLDAQVFDDGLRGWFIKPAPVLSTPVHALTVGDAGTVIDSQTDLSREDGFYNRVFTTYKWTDTGGTDHTIVSVRSVTTGPYAVATGNTRTMEVTYDLPATQTEADAATAALAKRVVTRGRSFQLTAVSAYWLRPGMTVTVTLPLGDPEEHLVAAVVFDLAAGTMTVTTRLPDGTYTIGA